MLMKKNNKSLANDQTDQSLVTLKVKLAKWLKKQILFPMMPNIFEFWLVGTGEVIFGGEFGVMG